MTQPRTPNIAHHVVVNAPIERAFAVFTERFGDFKPREHNLLAVPIAETVFEPRVGGYIYDRGVDGSVCRWARVLAYEPHAASYSAGTSAPPGKSRAMSIGRARSRYASTPKARSARGFGSSTET